MTNLNISVWCRNSLRKPTSSFIIYKNTFSLQNYTKSYSLQKILEHAKASFLFFSVMRYCCYFLRQFRNHSRTEHTYLFEVKRLSPMFKFWLKLFFSQIEIMHFFKLICAWKTNPAISLFSGIE